MSQEILNNVDRVDIGCGASEQRYSGCFGVDINDDYHPDLLHNCDDGIPLQTESVSFVNSDNSLEHFKNPYFVLKECYRILKPGGTMRLVVPNCQWFPLIFVNMFLDLDWLWHQWMHSPMKQERGLHWTLYTRFLITKVAIDIGFEVSERRGFLYSKEIELSLIKRHDS